MITLILLCLSSLTVKSVSAKPKALGCEPLDVWDGDVKYSSSPVPVGGSATIICKPGYTLDGLSTVNCVEGEQSSNSESGKPSRGPRDLTGGHWDMDDDEMPFCFENDEDEDRGVEKDGNRDGDEDGDDDGDEDKEGVEDEDNDRNGDVDENGEHGVETQGGCEPLDVVDADVKYSSSPVLVGGSATITCKPGYTLDGLSTVNCVEGKQSSSSESEKPLRGPRGLNEGHWDMDDDEMPFCFENDEDEDAEEDGDRDGDQDENGEKDKDGNEDGNKDNNENGDGDVDENEDQNEENGVGPQGGCDPLDVPDADVKYSSSPVLVDGSATITCNPGYTLDGQSTVNCVEGEPPRSEKPSRGPRGLKNGHWDMDYDEMPICIEDDDDDVDYEDEEQIEGIEVIEKKDKGF